MFAEAVGDEQPEADLGAGAVSTSAIGELQGLLVFARDVQVPLPQPVLGGRSRIPLRLPRCLLSFLNYLKRKNMLL